jgi:XRE family aerobic/anaerobic benzoate catabolism transcriptional regulator
VNPLTELEDMKRAPSSEGVADAENEFLIALGKRVREIRERRGMARKILARDADVSERYLAQLESGDGNVSIVLLRRIALALGVPLTELLGNSGASVEQRLIRRFLERLPEHRLEELIFRLMRDFGSEEAARKKRIALIGLRGAGKSTLGSLLAKELDLPFVELDKEIEREAGISLSEVFMLYGQSGYRRIELRCLERTIQNREHAVISVSGGIVSESDTYELLLAKCFTVWLRAAPEEHMARVAAQGDLRPMADNEEAMEDLRRILAARTPLYAKADAIVDTSNQTPAQSLIKLRRAVVT